MTVTAGCSGGTPASATASSVTVARAHTQPNKAKPEAIAEWKKALEEGMGYKHVAEVFGVSTTVIRKYLPGMGWTPQQAREHGTFMKHNNAKMRKMEQRNAIHVPHDPTHDAALDMMQRRFAGASQHSRPDD